MAAIPTTADDRVAVLVDCDNASPDALDHALRMVAQHGRVVVRRGYGNHATFARQWQQVMVDHSFTPCLQFSFASGKNTADIALALDALELLLDGRANTFCLVTSDSDFVHLCRKLRERGGKVLIAGDARSPIALRNAADQFYEWRAAAPLDPSAGQPGIEVASASVEKPAASPKRRPRFVVDAVGLLASDTVDGKVHLGPLGVYLRRTDPAFSTKTWGHSGLLEMLRTYDLLTLHAEQGGHWTVSLKAPASSQTAAMPGIEIFTAAPRSTDCPGP